MAPIGFTSAGVTTSQKMNFKLWVFLVLLLTTRVVSVVLHWPSRKPATFPFFLVFTFTMNMHVLGYGFLTSLSICIESSSNCIADIG